MICHVRSILFILFIYLFYYYFFFQISYRVLFLSFFIYLLFFFSLSFIFKPIVCVCVWRGTRGEGKKERREWRRYEEKVSNDIIILCGLTV